MRPKAAIALVLALHLSAADVHNVYRSPSASLETPLVERNARRDPRIPPGYQLFPPNDALPSSDVLGQDNTAGYGSQHGHDKPPHGAGYERPEIVPSDAPGYDYDRPSKNRRPTFADPISTTRSPATTAALGPPRRKPALAQADPSPGRYLYEPPNDPAAGKPAARDPTTSYLPPGSSPGTFLDSDGDKVPYGSYAPSPPDPPILQDFFPNRPSAIYLPPTDVVTVNVPDFQNFPADAYLPPADDPPPTNSYVPPSSYIPPSRDAEPPNETYLPPSGDDPRPPRDDRKHYLPPSAKNALQIQVVNMSCMQTPTRNYFRATLRTSRPLESPPIMENSPAGRCVSARSDSLYSVDLSGLGRMSGCGIRDCPGGRTHVCAKMRFPTVRGLKLPEDVLLTLQCRPQERVVSETKYLAVNPQEIRGRSAQTAVAAGGRQRDFTTNVALLRRSGESGEFNAVVRPGGAVLLGEELMLRANVKQGDGWRFSRFADVTMHRVSSGDRTSKHAVPLLDRHGCRNPAMRNVCPSQQAQERTDPLASHFPLRAFIFQDMSSGDEMVLSVRLLGCLEYGDCFSEASWPCREGDASHAFRKRRVRRETAANRTADWRSYLEFKVIVPSESRRYERIEGTGEPTQGRRAAWLPFVGAGLVLLATSVLALAALGKIRQRQR